MDGHDGGEITSPRLIFPSPLVNYRPIGYTEQMKYFREFNTPETIISVCSYPDPEHGIKELNAVAWHSEKTLKPLAHDKQKIVVIAEFTGDKTSYKDGKNMLIMRVWHKFKLGSLVEILTTILKFNNVKSVLFQFEFNVFGGIWPVLFLPCMLIVLKLSGKLIYFELHQVIFDIKKLANHVNVKNPLFQLVFNLGLRWFYFMVGLLSSQVIVLENDLRKRLKTVMDEDKIVFVPIAIQKQRTTSQVVAKQSLDIDPDDFCILVFGFINWYKGSDWIVDAIVNSKQRNIRLLMAGGENPTLKDKEYYQKFYNSVLEHAHKSKKVIMTGYVPDNQIKKYFSAADVVVLPYRVFMSASGPFSFALSFRKPVLLSTKLYNYSESEDFAQAMNSAHLRKKDMFFPFNQRTFNTLIAHLRQNEQEQSKLESFSEDLSAQRSTHSVVKKLEHILVPSEPVHGEVGVFAPFPAFAQK